MCYVINEVSGVVFRDVANESKTCMIEFDGYGLSLPNIEKVTQEILLLTYSFECRLPKKCISHINKWNSQVDFKKYYNILFSLFCYICRIYCVSMLVGNIHITQ